MRLNTLFFMIITVLVGCSSAPPAPVVIGSSASSRTVAPAPEPIAPRTTSLSPNAVAREPDALFHALGALDIDYRWGGNSRAQGFDCSGLVQYVYREAYGIQLPRLAVEQSRRGQVIPRADLEIGDLVFYNTQKQPYSHVGIYMGDGRFIHAPRTGASVRVEKMSSKYWSSRFDGARRIAL